MSQTKLAVLGLLTLGPMSGYALKKKSESSLAHFWHESYGNLYPRLAELQAEGLVTARTERRERAPDAIVYRITPRGRRELAEWLTEPAAPERTRSELLLKIFFGAQVPAESSIEQLLAYQAQQEAVRDTYAASEVRLRGELATVPDAAFHLMTLRRGQLLTEARLRWCDETIETLRQMSASQLTAKQA
jgi:DNA-binding PadR family transcriptional regulator